LTACIESGKIWSVCIVAASEAAGIVVPRQPRGAPRALRRVERSALRRG
jgi:hypothetical protein